MHIFILRGRSCFGRRKAFTIIEALIAISLLSVCGIALFGALYAGFNLVNDEVKRIDSLIIEIKDKRQKTANNCHKYCDNFLLHTTPL